MIQILQRILCTFALGLCLSQTLSAADALEPLLKNAFEKKVSEGALQDVQQIYAQRNFQPLWIQGGALTEAGKNLLETLKKSFEEGLEPSDYTRGLPEKFGSTDTEQLRVEIAFTKAALKYLDDLGGERFDPHAVARDVHLKPKVHDSVTLIQEKMKADPSGKWLLSHTYMNPEYLALKALLADYRKKAQSGEKWMTLPEGTSLKMGITGEVERIKILQQQLTQLGSYTGPISGVFDQKTEQALKQFQADNLIESDGVAGGKTLEALNNFNPNKRIQQIIISMERWRWLPEVMPTRYVQVNIAAFNLKAVQEDGVKLEMPVIIGQNYRHTPVFTSTIYSIRFNPSWHVPVSIALKDKLPKIRNNPDYLEAKGYSVYDSSGERVSPHSVDWSSLGRGHFPYRLVQAPGNSNALGKIRFSIESPFNVYLHSTPDKHLFLKPVRNFSSGCIRVSEPGKLAYFVFNDPSFWTQEKIDESMEGTRTQNVTLPNAVPVFITYFTVWRDKSGKFHFSNDIYQQDAKVASAINNRQGSL